MWEVSEQGSFYIACLLGEKAGDECSRINIFRQKWRLTPYHPTSHDFRFSIQLATLNIGSVGQIIGHSGKLLFRGQSSPLLAVLALNSVPENGSVRPPEALEKQGLVTNKWILAPK